MNGSESKPPSRKLVFLWSGFGALVFGDIVALQVVPGDAKLIVAGLFLAAVLGFLQCSLQIRDN